MLLRVGASVLLAVIFVVPNIASAQIPFWGPIIPGAYNVCAANWALVIDVINRIIALLITVAIVFVAPLMITWGGIEILVNPANPSKRSEARKRITNTVIGIVVALAAWLIVSALMAVLYRPADDPRGTWQNWQNIIRGDASEKCIELDASLQQADGTPYTGSDGVTTVPEVGAGYLSHEQAWARLQEQGGFTISSTGRCTDPTIRTCTSLHNIPEGAIENLMQIQAICNCSINITGGTETGHRTHGQQLPVVDLSYSDQVIEGIREFGYAINANFGRGATCEPPRQPGVAMDCGSGPVGHIHFKL